MHIRSLEIAGFTKHVATKLMFPKHGILLITGPNGAGKSSLPEAVSMALWNKPLRKRQGRKALRMWRSEGKITVTTDRVRAERTSKGKLKWFPEGDVDSVVFESTSKAQDNLEAVIGEHTLWARSKVFSSSDASHFTLAKDSERKRLLEMVLKLDAFDDAYDRCKADLRKVEKEITALTIDQGVLNERISNFTEQLDDVPKVIEPLEIEGTPITRRTMDTVITRLKKRVDAVQVEKQALAELRRDVDAHVQATARADASVESAQEALEAAEQGTCAACGAEITQEKQRQAKKRLKRAKEAAEEALQELTEARYVVQAAEERAQTALDGAEKARELLRDVAEWQDAAEAGRRQRYALGQKLEEAEERRDTASLKLEALQAEQSELQHVATALGLTGIRAAMLGAALAGIESVANTWLARFSESGDTPITVSLVPYSESAKGTISDAISLELHGVAVPDDAEEGVGQDYGVASGGERRRVDIAFLLALAEVESGASGHDAGTLWFDEVFDWLDEDGREAAFEIIEELAETACVVVITHNKQLIMGLLPQAAAVWQVEGGTVYDRKNGNSLSVGATDRK